MIANGRPAWRLKCNRVKRCCARVRPTCSAASRRWGGRLYLTDRRLSFHSHAFNVQTGVTDIPLSQVRGTHPCWTKFLGMIPLFPTSLAVSTADGGQYHFVVHDRDAWAAVIGAKLPGAGG